MIAISEIDLPIKNPEKWEYIDYKLIGEDMEIIGEYHIDNHKNYIVDHEYLNDESRTEGILIRWDDYDVIPNSETLRFKNEI